MATGFSVMDALNKNTKAGAEDSTPRGKFRTKDLSIFKIYANEGNFYPQEDIEQKAGEILAFGLLENLVVKYEPREAAGEYKLISGERRWRALCLLVEKGYKEFEFVTCNIIAPSTSQEERIALIIANSHRTKDMETMIHIEHPDMGYRRLRDAPKTTVCRNFCFRVWLYAESKFYLGC